MPRGVRAFTLVRAPTCEVAPALAASREPGRLRSSVSCCRAPGRVGWSTPATRDALGRGAHRDDRPASQGPVVDQRREVWRPTAREIADLLGELRQMLADANGYATGIPPERIEALLARKTYVLT